MKKIKVFQNGVYLRDIYPHASRFQVIKYNVAQAIGRFVRETIRFTKLTLTASIAVAVGAFLYGNYVGSTTHLIFAQSVPSSTLQTKLNSMQDDLITQISTLENKTNIPSIPDDNKSHTLALKDKVSYGCMQFKISTIEHYYSVLKLGQITDQDAAILAIDCTQAKSLAKQIIFQTDGGLWNWSVATPDMAAKVTIIKQLINN